MLSLSILLSITILYSHYTNAYVIDPCSKVKCNHPEISCLEYNSGLYECKCALECKNLPKNQPTTTQLPSFTSTSGNSTLKFNSRLIPIAKQGGVSCYQSACMNGGTCFTNYNVYTTMPIITTTTTASYNPYVPPICSCQAQFSGSRCELYNPTTQPTVQPDGWTNLCRVYNDKNMNICQNGGQCVFIADNKVACVCPSNFIGQYCELPVYIQCQGSAFSQCHRDYGTCQLDGRCLCNAGYSGPKCDLRVQNTQAPTLMPIVTQSSSCLSYYCLNGGTCRSSTVDPYVTCICPPAFTGLRCEICITGGGNIPLTTVSSTLQPRCNFTITLLNDGAYTSRLKVQYSIDGIVQPIYISPNLPFIGNTASVTLPYYAKDIIVIGERLGFTWVSTFQDTGINTATRCTKCYKVWGVVSNPEWDHLLC